MNQIKSTGDVFADHTTLMRAYGQKTTEFSADQVKLYIRLTLEELCEVMVAANPDDAEEIKMLFSALTDLAICRSNYDRVELFDGVIDVLVTTIGIGVSAHLPTRAGWEEVLGTNLAKIDPVTGLVTRDEHGKVQKPAGWKKPDLERILRAHDSK